MGLREFAVSSLAVALIAADAAPVRAMDLPDGFVEEVVVSGILLPTAMAFAPDGRIFITEKRGRVRIVTATGELLPTPFVTVPALGFGDRGVLGIALDSNFMENGYVYLFYTTENRPDPPPRPTSYLQRVSRFTAVGNVALEGSEVILVDGIPVDTVSHCGGALAFGPDGALYISTGDGADFTTADVFALRALDLDSLAGKILRVSPVDGSPLPDNPFYAGPDAIRSKVWSRGLRNPFKMAFRPGTSSLFVNDVGWSDWEEISLALRGANLGWPCHEGAFQQPEYQAAFPSTCAPSAPVPPIFAYQHVGGGAAITGGAFLTSQNFPSGYAGSYFFADFVNHTIERIVLDESNDLTGVYPFATGDDSFRPVALAEGPDGDLYALNLARDYNVSSGDLTRISYVGSGNRPPVARATATPPFGYAPLTVAFSSQGSFDPDGSNLTYEWDFGDGSSSTLANPIHRYTANGAYHARLTVGDGTARRTATVRVTVGSLPPRAIMVSPAQGETFRPGSPVQLSGYAFDRDDGLLSGGSLQWTILLHHNEHIHPALDISGPTGSFIPRDHGERGEDHIHYEVVFAATDFSGLMDIRTLTLFPEDNLALGRPATASSSASYPDFSGMPEHGNDGYIRNAMGEISGWHSAENTGGREWWQVDLEAPRRIASVVMEPRPDVDQPAARRQFEVLASNDPTFQTDVELLAGVGDVAFDPYLAWVADVTPSVAYRYVRVQKTVPDEFFNFAEFRVFGREPVDCDLAVESAAFDVDPSDPDVDPGPGAMGQAVDLVVTVRNVGNAAITSASLKSKVGIPGVGTRAVTMTFDDFDDAADGVQPLAPGAGAILRIPYEAGLLPLCGAYSMGVLNLSNRLRCEGGLEGDGARFNDRVIAIDSLVLRNAEILLAVSEPSETIEDPLEEPVVLEVDFRGLGPGGDSQRLRVHLDVLEDGAVVRPSARAFNVSGVASDASAIRSLQLDLSQVDPPLEAGRPYQVAMRVEHRDRGAECARGVTTNTFTIVP